MAMDRKRARGRKTGYSFVQLPHILLEHENWARLKPRAKALLIDVYSLYKGNNNGDLCATYSMMKQKGWTSNDQLQKAKKELLSTGWLIQTKQGGLGIGPSLYAVTFQSIDECNGKLDYKSTTTALGYWKRGYNPELNSSVRIQDQAEPPYGMSEKKLAPKYGTG